MSENPPETRTIDRLFLELSQFTRAKTGREIELEKQVEELRSALEQACHDLNQAHTQWMEDQGAEDPERLDWPEHTPQANTIRWAEELLGKRLAKTKSWTTRPEEESPYA